MTEAEIEELIEERNFFESTGAEAWSVLAKALGLQSGGLYQTALEAARRIERLEAAQRFKIITDSTSQIIYREWVF